jgi:hypothetical protein
MKPCRCAFFLVFLIIFSGCDLNDEPELQIFTKDFDFNVEEYEWAAGFADYPADSTDSVEFELRYAYTEPVVSKLTKRSIMLSGNNVNRDLFMYIKKRIDGLRPNTDYTLTFSIELASDANSIQPASGSVFLKAGATHGEPKSLIEDGQYAMNVDKGDGAASGADLVSLGDLLTQGNYAGYTLITRTNTMANNRYVAKTNSNGELWLIVGTDATVEGIAKVFYTRITVVFSAS